jgi:hypothetical protein
MGWDIVLKREMKAVRLSVKTLDLSKIDLFKGKLKWIK